MNEKQNMIAEFEYMTKILDAKNITSIRIDAISIRGIKWAVASYLSFMMKHPDHKPFYEEFVDYIYGDDDDIDHPVTRAQSRQYHKAFKTMETVQKRIFSQIIFKLCSSKHVPVKEIFLPIQMKGKAWVQCPYCESRARVAPNVSTDHECGMCGMKTKLISLL